MPQQAALFARPPIISVFQQVVAARDALSVSGGRRRTDGISTNCFVQSCPIPRYPPASPAAQPRWARPSAAVISPLISPPGPAYREDPIREEWKMKIHTVKGAAGVNLHVREYGKSTGIPILFIHGWSQNHVCWSKQYDSALKDDARIIALDLRGHGMSDAPLQTDQYTDGD